MSREVQARLGGQLASDEKIRGAVDVANAPNAVR
jgi:hypothetical protein